MFVRYPRVEKRLGLWVKMQFITHYLLTQWIWYLWKRIASVLFQNKSWLQRSGGVH